VIPAYVAAPAGVVVAGPATPAYRLELTWSPSRRTLSGTERITFTNPSPTEPLADVWVRVWANGWRPVGGSGAVPGCRHRRANVSVVVGGTIAGQEAGCSAYLIRLATAVAPAGAGSFTLQFRETVPRANDRFGIVGGVANLGNAVPILAVRDAARWHLDRYTATGESFYSLAATWDATIHAPRGVAVAATGTGPTRAGVTTVHADHARDFALAIGPMAIDRERVGPTRVRVFSPPSTRLSTRRSVLADARRALSTYSAIWGPYGAPELDVVIGAFTTFGGMEYPQIILTDTYRNAIVHEIAHQWWYGIVGDDQYHEPWLDESFASYGEQRVASTQVCDTPPVPVFPGYFLDSTMAVFDGHSRPYATVVYYGGACALADLAHRFGRARFDGFLRSYVAANRYGISTTAGFIAAVRQAAPAGLDVDAWLVGARLRAR
jgi:hypothetical protein